MTKYISGNEEWKEDSEISAKKLNNLEEVPQEICDAINKMPFMAKRDEQGNLLYSLKTIEDFTWTQEDVFKTHNDLSIGKYYYKIGSFKYKNTDTLKLNFVKFNLPLTLNHTGAGDTTNFFYAVEVKNQEQKFISKEKLSIYAKTKTFINFENKLLQALEQKETELTVYLVIENTAQQSKSVTITKPDDTELKNIQQAVEDQRYKIVWPEE